jgi:hypothetical protein
VLLAKCRDGDRSIVYKEIKHLTMLKDVRQVVHIYEVFEQAEDMCIVMEVSLLFSPSPSECSALLRSRSSHCHLLCCKT